MKITIAIINIYNDDLLNTLHSPSELADIEDLPWYMVYDLPFLNYLTVFSIPKPYIIKGKENYTQLDKKS